MNARTKSVSSTLDEAVDFLSKSSENGGIYGLSGSATGFVTASASVNSSRTIVVVLPDGDAAKTAAADIRFYLGEDEVFKQPLSDKVIRYPSSDVVPYSSVSVEADVWINRMAALFRLAELSAPKIMVTGLDALARKILPKQAFLKADFTLQVGQAVDRDELLERLVSAGYVRSPLVEDAGDFSARGFIIDIYSPLYPFPFRIEEMDETIESIRFFDPTNQRSRENVSEVHISPVHMIIPDQESRSAGMASIARECEERGVEKRVRQRILDDFRHKVRFPGAELYISYFFEHPESLLDYLPPDAVLVLPDSNTLGRFFEDLRDDVTRGWETAVEEGLPVPPPDRVYLFKEEFEAAAARFRTVVMAPLEIEEEGLKGIRVRCRSNTDIRSELLQTKAWDAAMAALVKRMADWRDQGNEIFLVSHTQGQATRLLKLLEPYSLNLDYRGGGFDQYNLITDPTPGIRLYVGELSAGFRIKDAGRIVICEEEIFGSRVRNAPRKRARGTLVWSLTDLAEGEAVVHEDYGIGIFRGLARKEFDGIAGEVMVIEYAGGDLLYHPVERLQLIQKYMSGSEEPAKLDKLGGRGWIKTKSRVKKSIRDMAKELLEIYAKRRVSTRRPYSKQEDILAAFEASFDFEETPDQSKAIQDIMEAMDTDVPMDRLVCGDVGYGKTEVAIRAAFRAAMDGKQVAVLVPTTVLAQQHFDTFSRRFGNYPVKVEVLSRFTTGADQKRIIHELKEGKLDLVIGTHKLLSKDVSFRDLGLLVIDEEQRFGVAHKEKIKQYKAHVDVLTLTATPIPRTLNLSLTGIRDLSVIETAPENRQSIRTHVMRKSDEVIREAVMRELNRGGQIFYVHNRVQSIYRRADSLRSLVPEAHIAVAHGQMADKDLERVMLDFIKGKWNMLVCTRIIESGLDIPRANTIIVERADTFGLADLYQLRGRVGRSHLRAYAYLLTPPEELMTPDAVKRLSVLQEYTTLGQGFRIAMRDMEIRGAGNMLGTSQSGHVAQVGYEMYLDLLEEAVREIKGEETSPKIDPEIRLRLEALIPEEYVPDPQQRMNLYKRLSRASDSGEIDEIEDEMLDLYGRMPHQATALIRIMRIRLMMKQLLILKLDYNGRDLVFTFDRETPVRAEVLILWADKDKRVRLLPDDRLLVRVGEQDAETRLDQCREILTGLSRNVAASSEQDGDTLHVIDGKIAPKRIENRGRSR